MTTNDSGNEEGDNMSLTLEEFLKTRGFTDEKVDYFKKENIDSNSLCIMNEEELKKIIPKYGDRVAIVNFCKKLNTRKKTSLIEKLRAKISAKDSKKDQENKVVSKRKKKETRIIEIGWLCNSKNSHELKYVRTQKGGGTRRVSVNGKLLCTEILEKALSLFFPNGKSLKGDINMFSYELLDYQRLQFDLTLTIQDMYELSALTTLRFYLSTIYKYGANSSDEDENELSGSSNPRSSRRLSQTVNLGNLVKEAMEEEEQLESQMVEIDTIDTTIITNNNDLLGFLEEGLNDVEANLDRVTQEIAASTSESYNIDLQHFNIPLDLPNTLVNQHIEIAEKICLVIHRGHIYDEILKSFEKHDMRNLKVSIEMILPTGESEKAEDIGGVFRDVLSEFWDDFYERCTVGTNYKVPTIRHDYGEIQWRAISDILVKGFKEENYFPLKLAPSFTKTVFSIEVDETEILNNFMNYVPQSEADILKRAIDNFCDVDYEELLEILDSYDCKWKPNESNIKQLLQDIAHKELIQKPSFIIQCFKLRIDDIAYIDLDDIYTKCEPSVKNIISKLQLSDSCDESDQKVFNFFKKYVRESDNKTRESLLRFSTGSNIVGPTIQIMFNNLTGAQRRPIAHTCTYMLELSRFYDTYLDFRNDFNEIFKSNIWIMDIV